MQKRVELLLSEIAEKYNLPIEVIKEVYNSEWLFVKRQINTLEFKTIMLIGWGKYIPSGKKMIKFKSTYDRKREERESKTTIFDKLIKEKNDRELSNKD